MSRLPAVSGRDPIRVLEIRGYRLDRQRGSHVLLREDATPHRRAVVPDHREVAKGTLRAILREAGLTAD